MTVSAPTRTIRHVAATQLYGMYDFEHEFQDGVNVLYGRNSVGKTTLLHILANALSGSFDRFAHLQFGEIKITLSDGSVIILGRTATSAVARITLVHKAVLDHGVGHFVALADREFDRFVLSPPLPRDPCTDHHIQDQLHYTRGHSIENYLFDFAVCHPM